MLDFVIRDMQDVDLEQVQALYGEMYDEQKAFGMIMELDKENIDSMLATQLKSKFHLLKVIDCGGVIKGFASVGIVKPQRKYFIEGQNFIGFIYDIYIMPGYRKNGWAGKLLTEIENSLRNLGVHYVELHVLEQNHIGMRFWAQMGYEDIIRVMYKHI